MEAASLPTAKRRRRGGGLQRSLPFLIGPAAVLALFFLGPMVAMLIISLQYAILSGSSGFTLTNFTDVLG
ncbi:MAG: sugar ABC transporter permease, partial [Vicinamibacteria bacterium]